MMFDVSFFALKTEGLILGQKWGWFFMVDFGQP